MEGGDEKDKIEGKVGSDKLKEEGDEKIKGEARKDTEKVINAIIK